MSLASCNPPSTDTQIQHEVDWIPSRLIRPNAFSASLYGPAEHQLNTDGLLQNIREHGVLVPLVVTPLGTNAYEILSGNRRLACAQQLEHDEVPCLVRYVPPGTARQQAIIAYNIQRSKTFTQRMREADALEQLLAPEARRRSQANLQPPDCREIDTRKPAPNVPPTRTDQTIARLIGLGSKDTYRQARAVWLAAQRQDARATAAASQLDEGTKTIHAAYKDLRRRDRFTTGFQPNPYDVWSFRHDPAFGIPHPGAIPPAIIAHAIHYFCPPNGLVVDPMAGGGTTLDVCQAMGRRCLSYDLNPRRPEIEAHDITRGLPEETRDCDLLFCDPPYHTMRAHQYGQNGVGELPLQDWIAFLQFLGSIAFLQLRAGGHIALLLANQTEKDLPSGTRYIDHVFLGYSALLQAGFQPVRRIHCPMSGGYRPQQVRQARADGRLLGQVRDLIVMRKPH